MGLTSDLDVKLSAYVKDPPGGAWRPWGTRERPASGWLLAGFLQEMRNAGRRPTLVLEGPGEATKRAARRIVVLLECPPTTGDKAAEYIRPGVARLLGDLKAGSP